MYLIIFFSNQLPRSDVVMVSIPGFQKSQIQAVSPTAIYNRLICMPLQSRYCPRITWKCLWFHPSVLQSSVSDYINIFPSANLEELKGQGAITHRSRELIAILPWALLPWAVERILRDSTSQALPYIIDRFCMGDFATHYDVQIHDYCRLVGVLGYIWEAPLCWISQYRGGIWQIIFRDIQRQEWLSWRL